MSLKKSYESTTKFIKNLWNWKRPIKKFKNTITIMCIKEFGKMLKL